MYFKKKVRLTVSAVFLLCVVLLSAWRISWVDRTFAIPVVEQADVGMPVYYDGMEYRVVGYEWLEGERLQELPDDYWIFDLPDYSSCGVLLIKLDIINNDNVEKQITDVKFSSVRLCGYENGMEILECSSDGTVQPGETISCTLASILQSYLYQKRNPTIKWILSVWPEYHSIQVR